MRGKNEEKNCAAKGKGGNWEGLSPTAGCPLDFINKISRVFRLILWDFSEVVTARKNGRSWKETATAGVRLLKMTTASQAPTNNHNR